MNLLTADEIDYLICLLQQDLERKGSNPAEIKYLEATRQRRLLLAEKLKTAWQSIGS